MTNLTKTKLEINVPEGATHYLNVDCYVEFLRQNSQQVWEYWNGEQESWEVAHTTRERIEIPQPNTEVVNAARSQFNFPGILDIADDAAVRSTEPGQYRVEATLTVAV